MASGSAFRTQLDRSSSWRHTDCLRARTIGSKMGACTLKRSIDVSAVSRIHGNLSMGDVRSQPFSCRSLVQHWLVLLFFCFARVADARFGWIVANGDFHILRSSHRVGGDTMVFFLY